MMLSSRYVPPFQSSPCQDPVSMLDFQSPLTSFPYQMPTNNEVPEQGGTTAQHERDSFADIFFDDGMLVNTSYPPVMSNSMAQSVETAEIQRLSMSRDGSFSSLVSSSLGNDSPYTHKTMSESPVSQIFTFSEPTTPLSLTSSIMGDRDLYDIQRAESPLSYSNIAFIPSGKRGQRKRPRRKFDEIERIYRCGWHNCTKSYGTLNHLNAHVTIHNHGPKRRSSEFRKIRHEWKQQKKAFQQHQSYEHQYQRSLQLEYQKAYIPSSIPDNTSCVSQDTSIVPLTSMATGSYF